MEIFTASFYYAKLFQDGRPCGGSARWYEYCLNALAAEALACCNGMKLARERGVRRLVLETDCLPGAHAYGRTDHINVRRFQPSLHKWRSLAGALKTSVYVSLALIVIG